MYRILESTLMCTITLLPPLGPHLDGTRTAKVRCSLTNSRSLSSVNPSRKPKKLASNVPIDFISPSLSSGRTINAGCMTRSASGGFEAGWDTGSFHRVLDRRCEYMHTLYPRLMIAPLRDAFHRGNPKPPTRSLGIHTAHIFLGNHPLMIQGCNILRECGYPEAAVMLVEDKQVCWEIVL
jgi:hypothetical protein